MKVKILAKEYEVIEKEVIQFGVPLFGQIDHINDQITLCGSMSDANKKVTLLHEILHSTFEQLGFSEEHDNEQLIKSLSTALMQILESNDELLSFLGLRQSTSSDSL